MTNEHKTVPVRKPKSQEFVRVHQSPEYRRNMLCVELAEDHEIYVVRPELAPMLIGEAVLKTLYTTISRLGTLTLWPVPLPSPDGRSNEWWRSGREAAEHAMKRWIRVEANMDLGAYDVYEAEAKIPEPEWPQVTFQEIIRIAFHDRLVDRVDHAVIQRLRGLS
jgi:hypothetical protein